jgi:hypothetical protein
MIQKTKQKLSHKKSNIRIQQPSSPPLKRETNSKLPSQASKLSLVKWFGEDICELILGINVVHIDITFLIVVKQEVKSDFYVFLSGGLGFWLRLWRWCYHKTKALA